MILALFGIFSLVWLIVPGGHFAGAQNAGLQVQGLGIDPFLIELEMSPGQSHEQIITLTNTTNQPLTFSVSINDFVVNGTTGQPLFLEAHELSDPKFSLSQWITVVQQPEFTIPPQAQTKVRFAVRVPPNAEPGTHYGGLLFTQPLSSFSGSEQSGALVRHKAGAIILVKLGKSQEQIRIDSFDVEQTVYRREAVKFSTMLVNDGNVHSKPKGDITIRNLFGRTVKQVPVNRDAQIILPQTGRDFESVWNPGWRLGKYSAEAVLYYGNPKIELRAQTSFWIIPVRELAILMVSLALLAVIGYNGIKRYNKYVINRSRGVKL